MNQPTPRPVGPPAPGQTPPSRPSRPTRTAVDDDTELDVLGTMPADDPDQRELSSTRVLDGAGVSQTPAAPATTDARMADAKSVIVGEDFRLVKKLGEGAMGAVYRARQLSFDRDVALKVLFPHVAKNPKLVERLYREARAMFDLDHPNIVHAFAVGDEQGCPYVAMEFVEGKSLQKWLNKLGRFSVGDAVHIIRACATGLAYAHKKGMVHRDIKPDNILVTRAGVVKIADLGMVKTFDDDLSLTQTGHAVGTPWYMPLEQAKNAKETDGRCDIYALGCTLYCMLTGTPPFNGATIIDVIRAKEQGTFPPARSVNPEVPERLDLLIAKMTAKLAKYRYQTCDELIQDLDGLGLAGARLKLGEPAPAPPSEVREPLPSRPSSGEIVTSTLLGDDKHDPNIWYLRLKGPGGQAVLRKYTTAQLQKKLAEGSVEPKTKASHNPRDGFRALATYKELEGSALSRASKEAADKNTTKYRNLYKKIEEQDRRREESERRRNTGLPPWLGFVLMVGAALLGLAGVAAFIYFVATMFR